MVDVSPVVVRALSLFGPGELRALRVCDDDVLRVILALLDVGPPGDGGASTSQLAQALESLCVVELTSGSAVSKAAAHSLHAAAAAIIERFAATITELRGPLPPHLLCESAGPGRLPVLSTCARLELLTNVSSYKPAAWLGLSQLHTLRGVDLRQVSMSAIAAALPRLHTLVAARSMWLTGSNEAGAAASVAGFFADLLPRLRVFQFHGSWPEVNAAAESATAPPLLPLLHELVWQNNSGTSMALRGFLGAQPTVLHAPVAEWLTGCDDGAPGGPSPRNGLARVCEFLVVRCADTAPADVSDIAHVLRAAPRLRTLRSDSLAFRGDMSWFTAATSAAPLHPSFVSLVHPRLRCLFVNARGRTRLDSDDGCGASQLRLRQTCFPRLQELVVIDKTGLSMG
jgi:hypothetical protein